MPDLAGTVAVRKKPLPGILHYEGFTGQFIAEGFDLGHFHRPAVCKKQANFRRRCEIELFATGISRC
jgi:hypothetical protein